MRPIVRTISQIIYGRAPVAPTLHGRAAQYVRMSTDHQKYSIVNQEALIAAYAIAKKLTIVRSYEDAGRSGLSADKREALRRLLEDVVDGKPDFDTVLVYDVSRWGRFQDVDEAAYYEYVCRRAGVTVHYCAEQFENDGGPLTAVVKGLKRAMAAEFSRELSFKTLEGQKRISQLGFYHGGTPAYGLRRLMIDEEGRPKKQLKFREGKHLHTDRVILVPGPVEELKVLREIFEMFVVQHVPVAHIARRLNERGVANSWGNRWTTNNVFKVLKNRSYVGDLVFNRTSERLMTKRRVNSRSEWIIKERAYQPVLDRGLFARAQELLSNSWSFNDADLLNYLTASLCVHGRLSSRIIQGRRFGPSIGTYCSRFGTLSKAFAAVGYDCKRRRIEVCDPAYQSPGRQRVYPRRTRRVHDEFRYHVPIR